MVNHSNVLTKSGCCYIIMKSGDIDLTDGKIRKGLMIIKNIYLKKAVAGIMAAAMMSSFAFPAVYAEEPADVQMTGQSENDFYDGISDVDAVAEEVFKSLDPEGNGSNPETFAGIGSETLIPLTQTGGAYINDKLQTCVIRKDLAYCEIKTYDGKELPADKLNTELLKADFKNTRIENRDGEYVLVSESITESKKAALFIGRDPAVSEVNEIWYYIKCGWEMDHMTLEFWYKPEDEIPSTDEIATYCSEFAPVEDCIFYYLNGEEQVPMVLVTFSEPFRAGTELTEKQFEFLEKYEQRLEEIKPDGIDEIVKKCRVPVCRSGFPCDRNGKLQIVCDDVIEVRPVEGEKYLRFLGAMENIEKVKEAPKDEEITDKVYYYVEDENPYVVFKDYQGEIHTLRGIEIEPRFYLDGAAETINKTSNDEVVFDSAEGRLRIVSGVTDLHAILYGHRNAYFICKETEWGYLIKSDNSPSQGLLYHSERKGNLDGSYCVDITDLSYLSLALLGELDLTDEQKEQGDVDDDGKLTMADLAKLRQFLSRKIETLSDKENDI